MKQLRFGILSAADIARKNWKSIFNSGNSVVTAVASRDLARSRRFIKELQSESPFPKAPEPLVGYETLLASDNVDAIYIPLPTGMRKEWVLRAAAAGKHVICEKPCGVNAAEVEEMIAACRKSRVQFMDGVMFMHHPRMERIRKALDDRKGFGPIKRITSNFSFRMAKNVYDTNVRLNSRLEPAGCLGDLGWYCIRFALWAMKWKLPREVKGRILSERGGAGSPSPVPVDFSAELIFDGNTSASFFCSFMAGYQNWVHVSGENGQLRVADFVHPVNDLESTFELDGRAVNVKSRSNRAKADAVAQQTSMIRNFASQVLSGELNEEWPMWALKTQMVVDACLESALKYSKVEA